MPAHMAFYSMLDIIIILILIEKHIFKIKKIKLKFLTKNLDLYLITKEELSVEASSTKIISISFNSFC